MSLQIELLESSFERLAPGADELADVFYTRLFEKHPEVAPLFKGPMDRQKRHLIGALTTIVKSLREPEKLRAYLEALALRHVAYGVRPEHYPLVGENLIASLSAVAGDVWTEELEQAWSDAYAAVQEIIYAALEENAAS